MPTGRILTENSSNFETDDPRGIDVNKNPGSPYYGRVFVANDGGSQPADILKFNADGSPADEGEYGTDGYPWAGDKYSPWKIAIGANDGVYVNDWSGPGLILKFSQVIDTNYQIALASASYPTNALVNLSGPLFDWAGDQRARSVDGAILRHRRASHGDSPLGHAIRRNC